MGIPFIETSALNGSNVEKAFVYMTRHIKNYIDKKGLRGVKANTLSSSGGVTLSTSEKSSTVRACCG
eukprot:gene764-814_t